MASTIEVAAWSTFSGASGSSLAQGIREAIDVAPYSDGLFYAIIKDLSGTGLQLHLQTSATEEDADFTNFLGPITTVGSTLLISLLATATTPMLRFVRWRISGASSAWTITFRIHAILKST